MKLRAFVLATVLGGRGAGAIAGALLGLGVASAVVLTGPDASAKSDYESLYGYSRTWNAALRMIRVDMNLKITEKDEQSGYLLFEYTTPESGKTTAGSIELIRGRESDDPVSVVVQLPQMPRYHEQVLVNHLVQKLHQEYGEPPTKHVPPPQAPPDAGAEAGEDFANQP